MNLRHLPTCRRPFRKLPLGKQLRRFIRKIEAFDQGGFSRAGTAVGPPSANRTHRGIGSGSVVGVSRRRGLHGVVPRASAGGVQADANVRSVAVFAARPSRAHDDPRLAVHL